MKLREKIIRYIILIIGVFFIGLGVAIAKRSDLGISPVSSVANILSIRFDFLSIGMWLMLWNCFVIVLEMIIQRREFKLIQLLQFPVSLMLGVFTDVGMYIVELLPTDSYYLRLFYVFLGVAVLAVGISLSVISDTVMNVGEMFVSIVSGKVNKSFGSVKVVFDVCCVGLSIILSLVLFGNVLGAREGTVITAALTGFAVKWLVKRIKAPILHLIKGKASVGI